MVFILELIGTVAFALSGAMLGVRKKMDLLGVVILGMTTAVGGGIIRDLILGITPPMAFRHPVYALLAVGVSLLTFLPVISGWINLNSAPVMVMDAVGLGIFTVIGVQAAADFDNVFLSVFVGTLTGVGGGVLRDLFAGDQPSIFVRHFYACASIAGALVCALVWGLNADLAMSLGAATVIVLRILAAKHKWNLPRA